MKDIIFDIPKDGIKDNDIIFIELTENCHFDQAQQIFDAFQHSHPKAEVCILHPEFIKSVRFFHKENNDYNFPF